MATQVKHVGNIGDKKVVIAYRTIPGDPFSALVIPAEKLPAMYHDELFKVVESNAGQTADELANVLAPKKFGDGNNMLYTLSQQGFLQKVDTKTVTVTPTPVKDNWIQLDQLNEEIAKQRGVDISELAVQDETQPTDTAEFKAQMAGNYRKRADQLYKEVLDLRRRADEIDPPAEPKKSSKAKAVDA